MCSDDAERGGRARWHYAVTQAGEEALRVSREIRERLRAQMEGARA